MYEITLNSHEKYHIKWVIVEFHVTNLLIFFLSCCRDLVHRQTSMSAIQHIALGVYGFGCEDALTHLMNYVWPNIFETSPHVVQASMGSIEGMRVGVGPSKILQYALQVPLLLLYSKTCLIQRLCNPFRCVIGHWFFIPIFYFSLFSDNLSIQTQNFFPTACCMRQALLYLCYSRWKLW